MTIIYVLIALALLLGLIIHWMDEAECGCERNGVGFPPCKDCELKLTCKSSEFYYER